MEPVAQEVRKETEKIEQRSNNISFEFIETFSSGRSAQATINLEEMRIIFCIAALSTALSAILTGCAGESKQDCVANFKGSGLHMRVSLVSGSTYRMELCGDSRVTYPAFTVYGAANESGISDPSILNRFRLSHVVANRSGDVVEVTFSSDIYFVVFADTTSQSGFQYANNTELIRGNLSTL